MIVNGACITYRLKLRKAHVAILRKKTGGAKLCSDNNNRLQVMHTILGPPTLDYVSIAYTILLSYYKCI
jgi:hypothetical protein